MKQSPGSTRILVWCALGWAALLVLLSFVLPVVTQLTGRDGPQPRFSLVATYGVAGALPAAGALAMTILAASLLGYGRSAPSTWSRAVVFGVAGTVLLAALVTTVLLHIGVFLLPLAVLLLLAALLSGPGAAAPRDGSAQQPADPQER